MTHSLWSMKVLGRLLFIGTFVFWVWWYSNCLMHMVCWCSFFFFLRINVSVDVCWVYIDNVCFLKRSLNFFSVFKSSLFMFHELKGLKRIGCFFFFFFFWGKITICWCFIKDPKGSWLKQWSNILWFDFRLWNIDDCILEISEQFAYPLEFLDIYNTW